MSSVSHAISIRRRHGSRPSPAAPIFCDTSAIGARVSIGQAAAMIHDEAHRPQFGRPAPGPIPERSRSERRRETHRRRNADRSAGSSRRKRARDVVERARQQRPRGRVRAGHRSMRSPLARVGARRRAVARSRLLAPLAPLHRADRRTRRIERADAPELDLDQPHLTQLARSTLSVSRNAHHAREIRLGAEDTGAGAARPRYRAVAASRARRRDSSARSGLGGARSVGVPIEDRPANPVVVGFSTRIDRLRLDRTRPAPAVAITVATVDRHVAARARRRRGLVRRPASSASSPVLISQDQVQPALPAPRRGPLCALFLHADHLSLGELRTGPGRMAPAARQQAAEPFARTQTRSILRCSFACTS